MRALWVPLWYPSPQVPNRNVWARELAHAAATRCDIRVLHAQAGGPGVGTAVETGIQVTRVRFAQARRRWVLPYVRAILRGAAALRKEYVFDVVHAHCAFPAGLAAMMVALRYRVPLVLTEHWAPYDQLMLSSRLTAVSIRAVVRQAAAVVAVSQALRAEMEEWTGRRDIEIVPPAVDASVFHPGFSHGRRDGGRLLFVGDLSHARKRLEDVLEAVAVVSRMGSPPDWHLVVVGGGELLPGYRALAVSLGIGSRVSFRGELALADIAEAMRECDLFVMPSNYETFGVVYAEALASGKPVVATRCGGPEDFVTEGVGRLVPIRDVPALAEAMCDVAARLDEFPPQALRSYAVERFSHRVIGQRYEEIYRRILA